VSEEQTEQQSELGFQTVVVVVAVPVAAELVVMVVLVVVALVVVVAVVLVVAVFAVVGVGIVGLVVDRIGRENQTRNQRDGNSFQFLQRPERIGRRIRRGSTLTKGRYYFFEFDWDSKEWKWQEQKE